MKSLAAFAKASPYMKPVMVLDGISHLAEQYNRIAAELKVLNNWVEDLPAYIEKGSCNGIDQEKLLPLLKQLADNADSLTEQMIINAQRSSTLKKFVTKKRRSS